MTSLKGMTWDHPRGYDPMIAVSAAWSRDHGVSVEWDKRSLQDFESYPVEKLAREYDLIVIDQNPYEVAATDLHKTNVLATYINGELVYSADQK